MAESPLDPYLPKDVRSLAARRREDVPFAEERTGAVLFADVSGFTAMSERLLAALGRTGAEVLTKTLNGDFGRMIAIVDRHGGLVQKFGGDAVTILFSGDAGRAAARAAAAAVEMQGAMPEFAAIPTPAGVFALAMKIGIDVGTCRTMVFGDPATRLDYVIEGIPVDGSAEAEHHAVAGDVVLSPAAAAAAGLSGEGAGSGFVKIREVPAARDAGVPVEPVPAADEVFFPAPLRSRLASGDAMLTNEHRRVAIVFLRFPNADYSGPDALGTLQSFFLRTEEILARYGGILAKVDFGDKGSKFLAVFGAPVAVEHHEEAAARAALELAAAAAATVGAVAIGVNAGSVFAGDVGSRTRREYTVMGDAVNLSARLMQHAGLGRILASGSVVDAAPAIEWEDVAPFSVKGKAEPVRAAVPKRVRGRESGAHDAAAGGWVERASLEAELSRRVDSLANAEGGDALSLTGPAGSGKSALLARAADRARLAGIPVFSHSLRSWEGALPFAWGRAVVPLLLGSTPEAGAGRLEARLRMRLASLDDLVPADLESFLRALGWRTGRLASRGGADDLAASVGAFARIVVAISPEGPALFTVDGGENADFLSERVLEALRPLPGPRLLLTASRSDPPIGGDRLEVPPLAESETAGLVAAALADPRIDRKVASFIHRRSAGNPLYVLSLVEQLRASGAIFLDVVGQRWTLEDSRAAAASFDSLESLLLRKVDALPEVPRKVIKTASALGDRFPKALLAAVERIPEETLEAVVARLAAESVLEASEDHLVFRDSLLRQSVYESLPAESRGPLHRAAARWLDRNRPEEVDLRAEQWFLAGATESAVPLLLSAAEGASRSLLLRRSLLHLGRLATLLDRPEEGFGAFGPTRNRAKLLEAQIRFDIGELPESERLLSDLVSSEADGSDAELLAALDLLGQILSRQGRLDECSSVADRLLRAAAGRGSVRFEGSGHVLRGTALARSGRLGEAEADLARAIDLLRRSREPSTLSRALSNHGMVLYHSGRPSEALVSYEEAVRTLRRSGPRTQLGSALINRSIAEMNLGRRLRAERSLREAGRIFESSGASGRLATVYGNLNVLALYQGKLDDAIRWSELHQECVRHLGMNRDGADSATVVAYAHLLRGEWEALLESARPFVLDDSGEIDPASYADLSLSCCRGLFDSGQPGKARTIVESLLSPTRAASNPRVAVTDLLSAFFAAGPVSEDSLRRASGSSFFEDRSIAFAFRCRSTSGLDGEARALAAQAEGAGAWQAALELHLLAGSLPGASASRSARTIERIARRIGSRLWEDRASALSARRVRLPLPLTLAISDPGGAEERNAPPSRPRDADHSTK